MISEKYFDHLYASILIQKQNSIVQIGRSDIEPPDYREQIETWFDQLLDEVRLKRPSYYVKEVNVVENSQQKILNLEYIYFDYGDSIGETTINIYRNTAAK